MSPISKPWPWPAQPSVIWFCTHLTSLWPLIHCAPHTQGSLLFLIMPSMFPPQGFALISSAWNALLSARYMLGLLPYFLQILAQMSPYQTEKIYQPIEHSKPWSWIGFWNLSGGRRGTQENDLCWGKSLCNSVIQDNVFRKTVSQSLFSGTWILEGEAAWQLGWKGK